MKFSWWIIKSCIIYSKIEEKNCCSCTFDLETKSSSLHFFPEMDLISKLLSFPSPVPKRLLFKMAFLFCVSEVFLTRASTEVTKRASIPTATIATSRFLTRKGDLTFEPTKFFLIFHLFFTDFDQCSG
jgi:hypothetical protein